MMEHPGEHADDRDRREQHRERSEEKNGEDADRADRADRRGSQNGNNNHNEHVVDYDEVNNEDYRYGIDGSLRTIKTLYYRLLFRISYHSHSCFNRASSSDNSGV
jgi:hypothetical protein